MYSKLLKNLAVILFCLIIIITFCNKNVMAYDVNNTEPKITYRAHVQDYGWEKDYKSPNDIVGTTGKVKQMEALEINLENAQGVVIQYRAHVQDYGWMGWTIVDNQHDTNFVGTTGKAKQMEAVQIVVKGLEGYQLQYRVHVSNIGWMDWITAEDNTNSTSFAGTTGRALQIEAFEIRLVPIEKDEQGDFTYRAHVQDYGWKTFKAIGGEEEEKQQTPSSNSFAGTTGKAKQMEALEINYNAPLGVELKYRAHVEDYGWMSWVTADNIKGTNFVGTTGKAKRIEAIQIVVENLTGYEIKYRAHVSEIGWMDWVTAEKDTNITIYAGTTGRALQMEAIEIVMVPHVHEVTPDWIIEKKPTCHEQGKKVKKCILCGEIVEQQITAPCSDTLVPDPTKNTEATCTNYGYEDYKVCSVCNTPYFKLKKPLGHDFDENFTIDRNPICTQEGEKSKHCKREGCSERTEITAIQKTEHNWESKKLDATCTTKGKIYKECSICHQEQIEQVINALGHLYGAYNSDNNATCYEHGTETAKCQRCDSTITRIDKNSGGHDFQEVLNSAKEAKCMDGKEADRKCTKCGYLLVGKTIKGKGYHNIVREITEQTCTKATIHETCTECDYNITIESGDYFALGHKFQLDPEGDGKNEYKCSVCGSKYSIGEKEKRVGWFVIYTVDTSKAQATNNKWYGKITLNSAQQFKETAPEPKTGYKFIGWYVYTKNGQKEKVEDSMVSGEDKKVLTTTWKDQFKTFEPCYEAE